MASGGGLDREQPFPHQLASEFTAHRSLDLGPLMAGGLLRSPQPLTSWMEYQHPPQRLSTQLINILKSERELCTQVKLGTRKPKP